MILLIEAVGVHRRVFGVDAGDNFPLLGYKRITEVPRRFLVARTSESLIHPGDGVGDEDLKRMEIIRVATL